MNFLRDQHDRANAIKRGSGVKPDSLDRTDEDGSKIYDPPGANEAPHTHLDQNWAREVLEVEQRLTDLESRLAAQDAAQQKGKVNQWR